MRAAPAPIAITNRNASCDGRVSDPNEIVIRASATPATALDTEVPIERISVFRLLAAAVAVTGTAAITSEGIAP